MASIKSDPQLTAVDKAIRRINTDLKRAADLFGTQSSQYGDLSAKAAKLLALVGDETLHLRKGRTESGEEYDILPRTRKALMQWTDSTAEKLIKKMEKGADYRKQEQWMLQRYAEQHGGKIPRGKGERRKAVQSIASVHKELNKMLSDALDQLYAIREETGDDTAAAMIRQLSRGQWTTAETKKEMIRIAQQEIDSYNTIDSDFFGAMGIDTSEM